MVDRATSELTLNESTKDEWSMQYTHPSILNSSFHKEVAARYDIWRIDKQVELN